MIGKMGSNEARRDERDARITALHARSLAAAKEAAKGEHHGPVWWGKLPLARELLREGTPDAIEWATALIQGVLDGQMLAPKHPHRGNFVWLAGDTEVVDFNAVLVVLRDLSPLLIEHADKLDAGFVELCRERLILALGEVERMDVSPIYSGVHQVMLAGLMLGAQWLGDPRIELLAAERWQRWYRFTVESGTTHEFVSPVYAGWALTGQALIQQFCDDLNVVLQSRLIYERLWITLGLRVHRPTRQVTAPHSRIYWGTMLSGRAPLKDILWRETGWPWLLEPGPYEENPSAAEPNGLDLALTQHWLPPAVRSWLVNQASALPAQVEEISDIREGSDITTYLTESYALGSTNRTYSIGTECFYIDHEANHLMLHYATPGKPGGWGMMYTRYVVNDRHWGKLAAAPDRSPKGNFYDQGNYAGVQLRNKAIGLYALKRQDQLVHSLKTVVAFQSGANVDQVLVNGQRVDMGNLPHKVSAGDWLVVADGDVYMGVHVLDPSCLGSDAPVLLEEGPTGELWLTIYNYQGVPKRFWDYASLGGAWWRGNIRAGVVVEIGTREEFPTAQDFASHLSKSTVIDITSDELIRTVTYRSGGDAISLDYDLWTTEPKARRINGSIYSPPHLGSPLAVQGDAGMLSVGRARLYTSPQQAWLIAQEFDTSQRHWVAVNPTGNATPMRLETPAGVITADAWPMGRIEWCAPEGGAQTLIIDARQAPGGLRVPEGVQVKLNLS